MVERFSCVLATILAAGISLGHVAYPSSVQAQEREQWLREHAVVVRTIDASDEDFTDLEPLVDAIADARVVQLGESSHGAGATFKAKVRLIKFLHQQMGFDVLVWESGMYDVSNVNGDLRAGNDPAEARRGVFSIWSDTEEVAPLFEYAQGSHAGPRPLEMAGFDMQFSGSSSDRFIEEMQAFFGAVQDPALRDRLLSLAEAVATASGRVTSSGDGPTPDDLDRFLATTDELLQLVGAQNHALVVAHGQPQTDYFARTLGNFRANGRHVYGYVAPGLPKEGPEWMANTNASWNRRDARNADNLLWLLNEHYRGRKLIVWAHNGPIMNAYYESDWSALSHAPQEGGMRPTGVFLAEAIGDEVYTIGFTAYAGEQRQQGGPGRLPVNAAPEGSLEHSLHQLGEAHLFLDFRQLDNQPEHWLRQPRTMAIRGYMPEEMEDWTKVVDAIFFTDAMTPSTWIRRR